MVPGPFRLLAHIWYEIFGISYCMEYSYAFFPSSQVMKETALNHITLSFREENKKERKKKRNNEKKRKRKHKKAYQSYVLLLCNEYSSKRR